MRHTVCSAHIVSQHRVLHRRAVDGKGQHVARCKCAAQRQGLDAGAPRQQQAGLGAHIDLECYPGGGSRHIHHRTGAGRAESTGSGSHGGTDGTGQGGSHPGPGHITGVAHIESAHGVLHCGPVDLERQQVAHNEVAIQREDFRAVGA